MKGRSALHIEIGMGKGNFIIGMARANPDIAYLGIERYESVMYKALLKLKDDFPENLRFLCEDAALIEDMFAPGEVGRIYLNFSDPWPKDRHAKRRLMSGNFLDKYTQILKKDGIIEFKTDNRALFDFAVEEAAANIESDGGAAGHTRGNAAVGAIAIDAAADGDAAAAVSNVEWRAAHAADDAACKLVAGRDGTADGAVLDGEFAP